MEKIVRKTLTDQIFDYIQDQIANGSWKRGEKLPSETELAEKLGVTRQTIIAIENDKYDPTLELAMKLSEFFGISVNDIFHLSH